MDRVLIGGEFLGAVVREIRGASVSVWVCMYEWCWYEGQRTGTVQDINRELCIRSKAKADVRVLLHSEAMGRHIYKINRKCAGHLERHGVKVKWGNTGRTNHAKVWIFDGTRAIIGSHNISTRAVKSNVEVSAITTDVEAVGRLVEWYGELWAKGL